MANYVWNIQNSIFLLYISSAKPFSSFSHNSHPLKSELLRRQPVSCVVVGEPQLSLLRTKEFRLRELYLQSAFYQRTIHNWPISFPLRKKYEKKKSFMETYKAFAGKQTNLNHIIQIAFNLALWYNFVEWIQCCILRVLIYFLKHMSCNIRRISCLAW